MCKQSSKSGSYQHNEARLGKTQIRWRPSFRGDICSPSNGTVMDKGWKEGASCPVVPTKDIELFVRVKESQ